MDKQQNVLTQLNKKSKLFYINFTTNKSKFENIKIKEIKKQNLS